MNKYDAILNQIAIHIAEANIATKLALQDAGLALTERQLIALKSLSRQLDLAGTAHFQADSSCLAQEPIYGTAAKPVAFSLRPVAKK